MEPTGTVVINTIGGMAGVAKTALALHWAHQLIDRFPDGQLYVNLRGFGPSVRAVAPGQAVRGFLDALAVSAGQIPVSPQARAGLHRSLLVGKRMLVLLDNARDEQQVRPLLPDSSPCLVVVTSRCQLAGLSAVEGAALVRLDVFGDAEAGEMLARRLGSGRACAGPDAAAELARLCGRLLLALSVVAARAAARPGFSLANLAAELRDAIARLAAAISQANHPAPPDHARRHTPGLVIAARCGGGSGGATRPGRAAGRGAGGS